ncbi:MAG: hypothetical protein ACYSTY_00990 [Planctomycetota bacterium]
MVNRPDPPIQLQPHGVAHTRDDPQIEMCQAVIVDQVRNDRRMMRLRVVQLAVEDQRGDGVLCEYVLRPRQVVSVRRQIRGDAHVAP